ASAPAQASTAAGDDVTGVDHVRDFTLASNDDVVDLREIAGCGQADRGDGGQHEHLLLGLFDHGFLLEGRVAGIATERIEDMQNCCLRVGLHHYIPFNYRP